MARPPSKRQLRREKAKVRQQQEAQAAINNNKGNTQHAEHHGQATAPIAPPQMGVERKINDEISGQQEASREKQIANADKYARSLSRWTAGLVVVGLLTVAVLFLQFCELRKADETTRAIQRGFAYVKDTPWGQFKKGNDLFWRWLIQWENSGNTPIKSVNFALACPTLNIPGGPNIADPYALKKMPNVQKNRSVISVILGPKQTSFGGQCEFPANDVVKFQNNNATQYIIGEATYTDIFEKKHITRYCN